MKDVAATAGAGPGPGGFGAGGAFRDAGGFGFRSGDVDFEDLLGGLFGGRASRGWGPVPGADQEAELEISLEEAYRGTRRSITVAGDGTTRTLEVRVPAGSSSGRRIRLGGRGLPNPNGPPGDLYAEIRIMVPRRLSRAERQLFEQLDQESHFNPRGRS
jgi:curved DNA-binding protein